MKKTELTKKQLVKYFRKRTKEYLELFKEQEEQGATWGGKIGTKKKIESYPVYPYYTCKKCGGEFQTNPPTYTMVGMDLRLCQKCDKKLNKTNEKQKTKNN